MVAAERPAPLALGRIGRRRGGTHEREADRRPVAGLWPRAAAFPRQPALGKIGVARSVLAVEGKLVFDRAVRRVDLHVARCLILRLAAGGPHGLRPGLERNELSFRTSLRAG